MKCSDCGRHYLQATWDDDKHIEVQVNDAVYLFNGNSLCGDHYELRLRLSMGRKPYSVVDELKKEETT